MSGRKIAITLAAMLAAGQGQAALLPAAASFDLMGSLQAITSSTFDQATGFDFAEGTSTLVYGTPGGTVTLGGFVNPVFTAAGFNTGVQGSVKDIANLSVGAPGISSFYSFLSGSNALSFDLSSITYIARTPANPAFGIAPTLAAYGTGTLPSPGYDATPGTFPLTTSNTGTGVTATFQSSVVTGAVPEPATWAMMIGGFGMIGAGMRRRGTATSFA